MRFIRVFVKYYLPLLLWMALIFSASSDKKSFQHSSRIIGPIVRWLFPKMPEESVNHWVFLVRKAAHVTEYAILAMLFWRALRKPPALRPWQWTQAGLVLFLVALYAMTDEWHQLFVPNRQGAFGDVLIDISGGALGLLLLWALGKFNKRSREPQPAD